MSDHHKHSSLWLIKPIVHVQEKMSYTVALSLEEVRQDLTHFSSCSRACEYPQLIIFCTKEPPQEFDLK